MKLENFMIILILSQINQSSLILDNQRNLEETPKTTTNTPTSKTTSSTSDTANVCNQDLMGAYGLTGMSTPNGGVHKYCPSITKNCCTPDD